MFPLVKVIKATSSLTTKQHGYPGSDSSASAARELELFFGRPKATTAIFDNCTLCIVKPHVVPTAMGQVVDSRAQSAF